MYSRQCLIHPPTTVGTKQALLWEELGVAEEAELVSGDRLTKLFLEHMSEVLRDCVTDLKELILESIELFEEQLVGDVQQTINKIDTELKVREGLN